MTAIVPFTAGSASDIIARIPLDQVSKRLGRPIVVESATFFTKVPFAPVGFALATASTNAFTFCRICASVKLASENGDVRVVAATRVVDAKTPRAPAAREDDDAHASPSKQD